MQSNTAVKVQRHTPEESQSEAKLGTGTILITLLLMIMVFSLVWFSVFNPFMA